VSQLRKLAADVGERSATFEAGRNTTLLNALGPAPQTQEEVLNLQEVRAWLRQLPPAERARKVVAAAESGDRVVLQALLRAPTSALIDIDPKLLEHVKAAAFAKVAPEKVARNEAARKALDVTASALDGVARLLAQY
jgi:negative regulator of sigma E activity